MISVQCEHRPEPVVVQESPVPTELVDLVENLHYKPGWEFELSNIDRGQGSVGFTLEIIPTVFNSQPPSTMVMRVDGSCHRKATQAEVSIESLVAGDSVVSFTRRTQEFVVRGRPLLHVEAHPFHGDLVVSKMGSVVCRYTPNHRCIVRVGRAFEDKYVVYLMGRGQSFRIGRCKGAYTASGKTRSHSVLGAIQRAHTENAERLWVLGIFDDEGDAAVAEMEYSWRYGIPTMCFQASNRSTARLTQSRVDDFWLNVGLLEENASALLVEVGKDLAYPLWMYGVGAGGLGLRYLAEIRACNLETGMEMIPFDRSRRRGDGLPIEVHRERYDGPVHSLGVDSSTDPLYIADGFVTHNSYHVERGCNYRFRHLVPVPPAAYDRRSWRRWLFEQIASVERHEAMEFFEVDGFKPFAPHHAPGNDPYLLFEHGTDLDVRTKFTGEVNEP